MSTILVTGAAGFIGSNFVRHWRRSQPDDTVVALDLLTYAGIRESLADVADEIHFIQGDIRDQAMVERLLRDNSISTVVNFAAESHNSNAILRPVDFFQTNVLGPVALLEAIRQVDPSIRFHQISTCEVYGDMDLDDPGAFAEDAAYRPRTPYNAAKAGGDHAVRAYGHTYGIPITITTSANNYGPYQFPEKVLPLFVTNALRGKPLPIYRSATNRREWLHVQDHCAAIEAVLTDGRLGETYHVGTGEEADIATLASTVLAELGLGEELKRTVADRPSHDRRYLLDSTKLRTELGWTPSIGFYAGLSETIRWYRENERWWRPLLGHSPIDEETAWRR